MKLEIVDDIGDMLNTSARVASYVLVKIYVTYIVFILENYYPFYITDFLIMSLTNKHYFA